MWAAADDVWDKDWIDVLYPILCANHCLSYGMVQTIDGKGDRIRHIANNRRFDFTGSVFIRRLKYFVQPAFLGKANLIYGVFPQKVFTRQLFDALGLNTCLLYTSDAADDLLCVDLGGRRIIKKKKQ